MTTKTLLLLAAALAAAVGLWLMLAGLPQSVASTPVTVFNYDPPGLPYTLITLRSGPGSDYARMGFLGPGLTVEAIARDRAGGWLLLAEPEAWVSITAGEVAGDIDALPVTDVTLPPPTVPAVTVRNPEGGSPIDARFGPAAAFDVMRTLEPGAAATAVARDPASLWLMIEPAGWIPVVDLEVTGTVESLPAIGIEF